MVAWELVAVNSIDLCLVAINVVCRQRRRMRVRQFFLVLARLGLRYRLRNLGF